MKAEIKFAITKNGPKAFMSTYNDDWTPANDTRLRVYKKDKRSVTPANAYPEGKGYDLIPYDKELNEATAKRKATRTRKRKDLGEDSETSNSKLEQIEIPDIPDEDPDDEDDD